MYGSRNDLFARVTLLEEAKRLDPGGLKNNYNLANAYFGKCYAYLKSNYTRSNEFHFFFWKPRNTFLIHHVQARHSSNSTTALVLPPPLTPPLAEPAYARRSQYAKQRSRPVQDEPQDGPRQRHRGALPREGPFDQGILS